MSRHGGILSQLCNSDFFQKQKYEGKSQISHIWNTYKIWKNWKLKNWAKKEPGSSRNSGMKALLRRGLLCVWSLSTPRNTRESVEPTTLNNCIFWGTTTRHCCCFSLVSNLCLFLASKWPGVPVFLLLPYLTENPENPCLHPTLNLNSYIENSTESHIVSAALQ